MYIPGSQVVSYPSWQFASQKKPVGQSNNSDPGPDSGELDPIGHHLPFPHGEQALSEV